MDVIYIAGHTFSGPPMYGSNLSVFNTCSSDKSVISFYLCSKFGRVSTHFVLVRILL